MNGLPPTKALHPPVMQRMDLPTQTCSKHAWRSSLPVSQERLGCWCDTALGPPTKPPLSQSAQLWFTCLRFCHALFTRDCQPPVRSFIPADSTEPIHAQVFKCTTCACPVQLQACHVTLSDTTHTLLRNRKEASSSPPFPLHPALDNLHLQRHTADPVDPIDTCASSAHPCPDLHLRNPLYPLSCAAHSPVRSVTLLTLLAPPAWLLGQRSAASAAAARSSAFSICTPAVARCCPCTTTTNPWSSTAGASHTSSCLNPGVHFHPCWF